MTRGVSERAPSREACASSLSFVWFQGSDESQESPPSSHADPPRILPGDGASSPATSCVCVPRRVAAAAPDSVVAGRAPLWVWCADLRGPPPAGRRQTGERLSPGQHSAERRHPREEGCRDTWALRTMRLSRNPKDICSQLCGFSADFYFPSAVRIFRHPFIYCLEDTAP